MDTGERCGPNTGIDYASLPPRDDTFNESIDQIIDCGLSLPQPIDNLTLKFPIGESRHYLDGLQVALRAKFQIRNADGTLLKTDKQMAPICGIVGTVVNRMTVWVNGTPWKTYNLYAYMYHVLNLLHNPKQWFNTLGTASGFIIDDTSFDDEYCWSLNSGLVLRREMAQRSRVFNVVGRLLCPIWLQERLLPTERLNWSIQLHLNSSDFVLYKNKEVTKDYKLYLVKAELLVTKIQLSEASNQLVRERFSKEENLLFPFVDYDVQSYSMSEGLLQRQTPPATLGVYPKRFYIFMVTQKQAVGNMRNNPLIYTGWNIETVQLDLGGRIFTSGDMDMIKSDFNRAYFDLVYRALGKVDGDTVIEPSNWRNMYAIFCFDVTMSRFSADCPMLTTPKENPTYSVFVKFKKALSEACQLIVLTESERVMSIAPSGVVGLS